MPTLATILESHARISPDRPAYTFLSDSGGPSGSFEIAAELTYSQLFARAQRVAAALRALRRSEPHRALLLLPHSARFVEATFGCWCDGACVVPAHVPSPGREHQTLGRLRSIAADARPTVVLTTSEHLGTREGIPELADIEWIAVDRLPADPPATLSVADESESLALLQYSSGSTGAPRGVMVTHRSLLHNQELIQEAFEHTASTTWGSSGTCSNPPTSGRAVFL